MYATTPTICSAYVVIVPYLSLIKRQFTSTIISRSANSLVVQLSGISSDIQGFITTFKIRKCEFIESANTSSWQEDSTENIDYCVET